MLSIQSYIESDKLLYQVGELRPGFLDKDTSLIKGPSPDNSLNLCVYDSMAGGDGEAINSFKLVEKTHPATGEKMFIIE